MTSGLRHYQNTGRAACTLTLPQVHFQTKSVVTTIVNDTLQNLTGSEIKVPLLTRSSNELH